MTRQYEATLQICCPPGGNEIKVARLISAIYLIAHQGVAQIGGMHTNLVHASCVGTAAKQ